MSHQKSFSISSYHLDFLTSNIASRSQNRYDIFQGQMNSILNHFRSNATKIYLDNVFCTSDDSFDDNIICVGATLDVLKRVGMEFNAKKNTCCETGLEFLGFRETCNGNKSVKS